MELPLHIKQLIEEELADIPLKSLTASSEQITKSYKSEDKEGKILLSDNLATLTYAAVRMPATFGAASFAFEKISELYDNEITTLLDIGAGTGALSWAASEVFDSLSTIKCIEREKNMIDIGKKLMKNGGFPCDYEWQQADLNRISEFPHADMAAASYVTNEMKERDRKELIEKLWNAADKLLVIIEPGTPGGFQVIKNIRSQLISLGGNIIAPCPSGGECFLPSDDWCHFTQRIPRSKLHKLIKGGDVPFEDEKFCYIAVSKDASTPCAARILRHPRIESGKITLKLCSKDGISERIVTKKDKSFKSARKSDCGDSFNI